MISSRDKQWHYLAVKKLSASLIVITCKHHGDFYSLNCFHSFAAENRLQRYKRVCENKDLFNIIMLSRATKIFEFSQYQNFDKALFIIYAYLKCIIAKID